MISNSAVSVRSRSASTIVLLLAAGIALLLVAGGCGLGNPYPPGSYERGQYFVEKENFAEAVLALESFVRHNPTDSLAAEAQYLKAMTTMEMKEYPLAAVEFQILRKDYPTSPLVEDAFFQEGVSYYRQVGRVQRDITGALDARIHFSQFQSRYPDSKFNEEVNEYVLDISDLVVAKRLRQCKVFHQLHRPEAVALTLDTVLAAEPQSRLVDLALLERGRIAEKLDDATGARTAYGRLVQQFPDSKYADEARSALERLIADDSGNEAETSS